MVVIVDGYLYVFTAALARVYALTAVAVLVYWQGISLVIIVLGDAGHNVPRDTRCNRTASTDQHDCSGSTGDFVIGERVAICRLDQ